MRRRRAALSLLGLSALAIVSGCAGGPPRARTAHDLLDEELAAIAGDPQHPLASLSVLALRGGRVVYEKQLGRRRIDAADPARDLPANAHTLYRVASVSKLVTTLVVLRLVEEGKLALDADVGSYLGYTVRNPRFPAVPVTLRMLLTHTSSLRDGAGYNFEENTTLRDVLWPGTEAVWSPRAPPGTWFEYTNLAWGVAGTVVERVTGERFDAAARRLVLVPLGMSGSFDPASLAPERLADLATLYRKRAPGEDTNPWNPTGPWIAQVDDHAAGPPRSRAGAGYVPGRNATLFAPQGGLRASAADLGRVLRMLAGGGELDGQRFLRPETVAEMLSAQWRFEGDNGQPHYGRRRSRFLSWGLGTQRFLDVTGPGSGDRLVEGGGLVAVGHHGDAYGLTAVAAVDPASGDGMVVIVGGTGFDPDSDPGAYSSLARHEERILTALHRRAILGNPD